MAAGDANPLAVEKLRAKTPVPSPLDTAGMEDIPLALRERAFFSSEILKLQWLQDAQNDLQNAIEVLRRPSDGAYQTRERFIEEMAKRGRQLGLDPRGDASTASRYGGLRDPTSERRLGLIYDFQNESVHEYARWRSGQDAGALDAFPAQEFVRVKTVKTPRQNWPERFVKAGGKLIAGRMVALKSDPVWKKMNRFGVPWAPFDFGSGMGLRDLSRRESEKLGLIQPGEKPVPAMKGLNDDLEASVQNLSPQIREKLNDAFGDQVVIEGDSAKWRGNLIADLYDQATSQPQFKDRVSLGKMSRRAVQAVQDATGEDLTDWEFDLAADDIRHALKKHGGLTETRGDQQPIDRSDFEALPWVLRAPDVAGAGDEPGTIGLTKEMDGNLITIFIERSQKNRKANLRTMWKKK